MAVTRMRRPAQKSDIEFGERLILRRQSLQMTRKTLGGLDVLVFTAGIGEHQPEIRAAIAGRLNWMGLDLDQCANAQSVQKISATSSRVTALVLATDEEQVIADDAWKIAADGRLRTERI